MLLLVPFPFIIAVCRMSSSSSAPLYSPARLCSVLCVNVKIHSEKFTPLFLVFYFFHSHFFVLCLRLCLSVCPSVWVLCAVCQTTTYARTHTHAWTNNNNLHTHTHTHFYRATRALNSRSKDWPNRASTTCLFVAPVSGTSKSTATWRQPTADGR